MTLLDSPESNTGPYDQIEKWLTEHLKVLVNVDARKIIEFQSFLDSQTGSTIVTVPNTIVRLCGEAGLDLAHQAIRILSESEYSKLRGDPAR
jgi:hypothetical protein